MSSDLNEEEQNVSGETKEYRRLSEAEWIEAVHIFETGKMSKTELARKFRLSLKGMDIGLRKRGAVYASKSNLIAENLVEADRSESARRADEITKMRERQRSSIELLQRYQNKIVQECIRDQKPLSTKMEEVKVLSMLIKNQKTIREDFWAIYGLDREPEQTEDTPDFVVSEYTPEELDQINAKTFKKEDPTETIDDIAASIGIEVP